MRCVYYGIDSIQLLRLDINVSIRPKGEEGLRYVALDSLDPCMRCVYYGIDSIQIHRLDINVSIRPKGEEGLRYVALDSLGPLLIHDHYSIQIHTERYSRYLMSRRLGVAGCKMDIQQNVSISCPSVYYSEYSIQLRGK
jgi:aryl carrier-like protein